MFKITGSSDLPQKNNSDDVVGGNGNDRNLSKSKKLKNTKSEIQTHIKTMREPTFLTPGTRKTFNQLRQAFTKALILRHFDLKCHIRIETDALGYVIERVLSSLTSDYLTFDQGQWQPIAYFLKKMIPAEIRYKTHNGELLAIVEAFKIRRHYLEGCKHEVLALTDYNNLCQFMDIKSLSFRQIRWAQELSWYHFQIDYCQEKAHRAADALSRFFQKNQAEKNKLQTKNTRIFHKLQFSLTHTSFWDPSTSTNFSSLYWVLICSTQVLLQLWQFWNMFKPN